MGAEINRAAEVGKSIGKSTEEGISRREFVKEQAAKLMTLTSLPMLLKAAEAQAIAASQSAQTTQASKVDFNKLVVQLSKVGSVREVNPKGEKTVVIFSSTHDAETENKVVNAVTTAKGFYPFKVLGIEGYEGKSERPSLSAADRLALSRIYQKDSDRVMSADRLAELQGPGNAPNASVNTLGPLFLLDNVQHVGLESANSAVGVLLSDPQANSMVPLARGAINSFVPFARGAFNAAEKGNWGLSPMAKLYLVEHVCNFLGSINASLKAGKPFVYAIGNEITPEAHFAINAMALLKDKFECPAVRLIDHAELLKGATRETPITAITPRSGTKFTAAYEQYLDWQTKNFVYPRNAEAAGILAREMNDQKTEFGAVVIGVGHTLKGKGIEAPLTIQDYLARQGIRTIVVDWRELSPAELATKHLEPNRSIVEKIQLGLERKFQW